MSFREEAASRAQEYARRSQQVVGRELGHGVHGIVFTVESHPELRAIPGQSAIKVHRNDTFYVRERDVYFRLKEHGIEAIRGCFVPSLLNHDDDLSILEMTVVSRPFVLDFGGAYLDKPPDFPDEVMVDWAVEKQDQFGARWPDVQAILRFLEVYGVFMVDVNPGNIAFDD